MSPLFLRYRLVAIVAIALVPACTYDFDAPFQDSAAGAAGSSTGGAGHGATGGSAGSGGEKPCLWSVPRPPDGWTVGYGFAVNSTVTCSDKTRPLVDSGLSLHETPPLVKDSSCACKCGAATGGTCSATVDLYETQFCTGTPAQHVTGDGCAVLKDGLNTTIAAAKAVVTSQSEPTCTNGVEELTKGEVVWDDPVHGCVVPTEAGVSTGDVCLSTAVSPADTPVCVFHAGDADCISDYTEKRTLYAKTYKDTRACPTDTCLCELDGQVRCLMGMDIFGNKSCAGKHKSLNMLDQNCNDASSFFSSTSGGVRIQAQQNPQTLCAVSSTQQQVTVEGSVTPQVVTVCCQGE